MKKSYAVEKTAYYLKWFCITNVVYFYFIGMEECLWIKGNEVCRTLSSIINDICIELCIFTICIVYYGKKIKLKKIKMALWIMFYSIVGIVCNSCISKEIKIMFNYYIYIFILLLMISVCIIVQRLNLSK